MMTALRMMTFLGWKAFLSAILYLKPDSYTDVWEQVRDGGYVGCGITIDIDPKFEGPGAWGLFDSAPTTSLLNHHGGRSPMTNTNDLSHRILQTIATVRVLNQASTSDDKD
jgi:hypothetical protein